MLTSMNSERNQTRRLHQISKIRIDIVSIQYIRKKLNPSKRYISLLQELLKKKSFNSLLKIYLDRLSFHSVYFFSR